MFTDIQNEKGLIALIMLNIFMFYIPTYFYPVNLQHSSCWHAFLIVENSVDPDQMALLEASRPAGSTVFSKQDMSHDM